MLLASQPLELNRVGVINGAGLRHELRKGEVIEFVHEVFAVREVEFEGKLSFKVG